VVGGTWLCLRVIDVAFALKESRFGVTSSDKISMVQLGRKLSKIMAVIVGALVVFRIAGINIPAVLAGLGIGGIANIRKERARRSFLPGQLASSRVL
jgi:small-conductance mechanosensitive channel